MLAGIYYGAQYGGSTTAILVNMPGETSSVVTCLDGYQMARKGQAGAALAIAALGSFFAGTRRDGARRRVLAAAVRARAQVRPRRILLADGAGPDRRRRARARLAAEGDRDDHPRACCSASSAPTSTPASRASTSAFPSCPTASASSASRWASSASPRSSSTSSRPRSASSSPSKVKGLLADEGSSSRRRAPAVLRGTGIGSILGLLPGGGAMLVVVRVLRGREEDREGPVASSARARSRASPVPSPRTTPARRRRSSRC